MRLQKVIYKTREEAMVMIQRVAKIADLSGQGNNVESFKEASKVSDWSKNAITFNVKNGVIIGLNGKIQLIDE